MRSKESFFQVIICVVLLLSVMSVTGCGIAGGPRLRPSTHACGDSRGRFHDAESVGQHNYSSFLGEHDGVVYTARGGCIDIGHLRIAADNVYFLNKKVSRHLEKGRTAFTYKLNADPSIYHVSVIYPAGFQSLPESEQQRIINEISPELAQYFTWQMISWHEVITWFGYKVAGVIPQFVSAFSWEDPYSNLVGTRLGAEAISMKGYSFNDAMTYCLDTELERLGSVSADQAYAASKSMEGQWYKDTILGVKVLLRSFDLGCDSDKCVTPSLVPGACPGAQPLCYPVPQLTTAQKYGFGIALQIEPREYMRGKYLAVLYPYGDRGWVTPSVDMPILLNYIRHQAADWGYQIAANTCDTTFEHEKTVAAKDRTKTAY
ncbi:MAG: DUF4056 domain-containing protein [Phycisphaerae bacterium]|nr:DUF4056 domain-containing protein [Phycisphaerae bacterium]